MARPGQVVERMVRAACDQGITRPDALQAVALACDHFLERYAGNKGLNLAFIKAVRGSALNKLRTEPPNNVLPMRGQAQRKDRAE